MQGMIQKRLRYVRLILAALVVVGLPAALTATSFAAASASWNNKNGSIDYGGNNYVQHPVALGVTSGGGEIYVPKGEADKQGDKGFAPGSGCPSALIIVSGSLKSAKSATYYSKPFSDPTGCDYEKTANVTFSNKYTYKAPTSGNLLDNGLSSPPSDGGSSTCNTSDGSFESDPAACGTGAPCKTADNCDLVSKYVNPIINKFLAPLAVLAVVIGIIWGAIEYIVAGGDAQKVAQGKARIQKAVFAFVALLFLYAFLNWLIPGGLLG